jgi:hypothetical protein
MFSAASAAFVLSAGNTLRPEYRQLLNCAKEREKTSFPLEKKLEPVEGLGSLRTATLHGKVMRIKKHVPTCGIVSLFHNNDS